MSVCLSVCLSVSVSLCRSISFCSCLFICLPPVRGDRKKQCTRGRRGTPEEHVPQRAVACNGGEKGGASECLPNVVACGGTGPSWPLGVFADLAYLHGCALLEPFRIFFSRHLRVLSNFARPSKYVHFCETVPAFSPVTCGYLATIACPCKYSPSGVLWSCLDIPPPVTCGSSGILPAPSNDVQTCTAILTCFFCRVRVLSNFARPLFLCCCARWWVWGGAMAVRDCDWLLRRAGGEKEGATHPDDEGMYQQSYSAVGEDNTIDS